MGEGNIKNYQVNYVIEASGNAAEFFAGMAKNAEALVEPLKALEKQIGTVQTSLNSLKSLFKITPTVDTETLRTHLGNVEEIVKQSAARMAGDLNKVISGGFTLDRSSLQKVRRSVGEIKKEMSQVNNDFMKFTTQSKGSLADVYQGGKSKGKPIIHDLKALKTEKEKALYTRYKDLKAELREAEKYSATLSPTASSIINSSAKHEDISATAKAIKELNKTVTAWKTKKPITVTIDANISDALRKLEEFITKAQSTKAIVPVGIQPVEEKTKGKDKKAGVVTSQTVTAAARGQKSAVDIKTKLNTAKLTEDLAQSIAAMQKLANEKAVLLKASINLGKAGYQLNQAMSYLQKMADSKPIMLTVATETAPAKKVVTGNSKAKTAKTPVVGGEAIKEVTASISKLQRLANEVPIKFRSYFNGGDAAEGASLSRGKIQQFVSEKPIVFRSYFNGGDAAEGASLSRGKIQQFVSEKPIVFRSYFNGGDAAEGASLSIGKIQKLVNEKPITIKVVTDINKKTSQVTEALTKLQQAADKKAVKIKTVLTATKATSNFTNVVSTIQGWADKKSILLNAKVKAIKQSTDFEKSMTKIQGWADKKPVGLHIKFGIQEASAKLTQLIAKLQELANGKPIAIAATAATSATATTPGATATAPATSGATSSNKKTNIASLTATPAQISAYNRHQAEMQAMRDGRWIDRTIAESKEKILAHQKKQQLYNSLWGSGAISSERSQKAAKAAIEKNAQVLDRIRSASPQPEPNKKIANQGARVKPKASLEARARAFWYPFTGNTSFGARTPMVVDMAKGMGTMFAVGGAMSAVSNSISQSVAYQNMMKTTNAILKNGTDNYSDSSFKDMERVVRQVGKDTKFTAPEVASAAKFLAMAGYDTPSISAAIKPVSNIALIGDTNLGETADKLTNVMTTFGINPKGMNDVADIMATTFTRSNTDMMMLAESAKYAGGIAHLYGGNFKNNFADVMAMFGVMGNAGVQASSAGTTLRMMYQNLMQPNKNQKAALNEYGITTRDSSGNPLEMANILKQIAEKVPKAQLADAVGKMFRITAQPGAAALVHAMENESLPKLMAANRNAAGSGIAENIANEKKNTIAGLWAQVQSTFTEGILQAFEGKEGGWAGQLARLRDYLAQPETVDMLRSIVDLVEKLAEIIGRFAKIYAKVYNMFPGLINGWMHIQLIATQFGYLMTPVVQLTSLLSKLKGVLTGTAAAVAATTAAETIAGRTRRANAVTGVLGATSQFIPRGASRGLVAANIAGGMLSYNKRSPYNNFYSPITPVPVVDVPAPLSLRQNRVIPLSLAAQAGIQERIALYERSRMYQMGGMTKHQKKQLNDTINRKVAELRASTNPRVVTPLPLWGYPSLGHLTHDYGRATSTAYRYRAGIDKVMPFNEYSNGASAILHGGKRDISKADKYRLYAQKWGAISAYQKVPAAKRAMAAEKAEMYLLAAMWASQNENALRHKRISDIAAKRHAARGIINGDVVSRYARTANWKNGMGLAWKNSFSAGRAMGVLQLGGIVASLKGMFASLIGGFAKAIGMLTSPVGLAVGALALLGSGIYKIYSDYQERKEQLELAKGNSKWAEESYKKINANKLSGSIEAGGFKPVEVGYAKQVEEDSPSYSLKDNKVAAAIIDGKTNSLTGSEIYKHYVHNFKYLPDDFAKQQIKDAKLLKDLGGQAHVNIEAIDRSRAENARKAAVVSQWADLAVNQSDVVQAQKDLQKAIFDKDFNRVRSILNAYKPTSTQKMAAMVDAKSIGKLKDPSKFYEWQYAQYKLLQDTWKNYEGPSQNYSKAMSLIDELKGMKKESLANFDGTKLAQALFSAVPIQYNGHAAQITLDKMGRVDWIALAHSVNEGIPFTIAEQQEILRNTYDAIYNDPNIKNFASVIGLLEKYLPQIADQQSPYGEEHWKPGEINDNNPFQPDEEDIRTPYAAPSGKPSALKPVKLTDWLKPKMTLPTYVSDLDEEMKKQKTLPYLRGAINYKDKFANNFSENSAHAKTLNGHQPVSGGVTRHNSSQGKGQKEYQNTYNRTSARPTQVIINIDKLANFDRTAIAGNSDERAIAEAIETKIAEAVAMVSAQALNSASSLIAQGV